MTDTKKVRYLKIDRGRYFYQRRIPLGLKECFPNEDVWRRPCGNVTYPKAVQLVVTWAEEHDKLIARLKSPDEREAYLLDHRKREHELLDTFVADNGAEIIHFLPPEIEGCSITYGQETEPNWLWAKSRLNDLDKQRLGGLPESWAEAQFLARLSRWKAGKLQPTQTTVPPYQRYIEILEMAQFCAFREFVTFEKTLPKPLSDAEYAYELQSILEKVYGKNSPNPPKKIDDREEHFFIKSKIERKLSEVVANPNTISSVLEKYIAFNQIKNLTARKYRRDVSRLIKIFGDMPINQITPAHLKELREELVFEIKPASLQAVFTPIKGLLRYAFNEQLIEFNPMSAVALPKDKRPIEERKWKKFDPNEVQRIDEALRIIWENNVQGLSEKRRKAFVMVVRVLMFSGMRPIEVLRLKPSDVSARLIRISGSKTESSTRVIPVHPEIKDFPEWIQSGGLETYRNIETDAVGAIRHNFTKLIRKTLNPAISDEQKALYSLRSTFVNAMRRAGADIQMQRAILGHKESGAIRHYDDGPEFEKKYEAVSRTDPRIEND
ncbi:tyrosine-type recombinase/integrase [Roseicyclus mahoneyensis]|nr:tyrosine-type recombinase/integrase [Roseicyclus mahoneyensis]